LRWLQWGDYRCCGCDKSIHWFCSEGDKDINAEKGHSAHYHCISCSPQAKQSAHSEEASKRVKKVKRWREKGQYAKDRPSSFWLGLCEKYEAGKYASQCAFLCSKESGDEVNTNDHQQIFQRKRKAFHAGTLIDSDRKRDRVGSYLPAEEKLSKYIKLRSQLFVRDKCGLSYLYLQEKARHFAKQLGFDETFKASNGWISNVLRRGNKKSVALHGEGMEMSPEMLVQNKTKFLAQLNACMEKYSILFERLYNADQTGLFFNKMPNRIYLD
jgi:hypothetical protein